MLQVDKKRVASNVPIVAIDVTTSGPLTVTCDQVLCIKIKRSIRVLFVKICFLCYFIFLFSNTANLLRTSEKGLGSWFGRGARESGRPCTVAV